MGPPGPRVGETRSGTEKLHSTGSSTPGTVTWAVYSPGAIGATGSSSAARRPGSTCTAAETSRPARSVRTNLRRSTSFVTGWERTTSTLDSGDTSAAPAGGKCATTATVGSRPVHQATPATATAASRPSTTSRAGQPPGRGA